MAFLALSADDKLGYDQDTAQFFTGLRCPAFAFTRDRFPEMMAVARQKGDIHAWASGAGIATVRAPS